MKFGNYLRSKREARGWTQPEASARAEIEQSYLSKLETGKSYPSEDVFARLVAVYGIDVGELSEAVSSSELAKLSEVADVRAAVLDRQRIQRKSARGWMLAGLAMLMAGGASVGVTSLARSTISTEVEYVSLGVLKPDEPLDAFDLVDREIHPDHPAHETLRAQQQELIGRLDPVQVITREPRGDWYVEETPEGRRAFHNFRFEKIDDPSPLRWFIVPGLAFLTGSLGCALIALRWR